MHVAFTEGQATEGAYLRSHACDGEPDKYRLLSSSKSGQSTGACFTDSVPPQRGHLGGPLNRGVGLTETSYVRASERRVNKIAQGKMCTGIKSISKLTELFSFYFLLNTAKRRKTKRRFW